MIGLFCLCFRYYGGSFRNDVIHGFGTLIYENGDRYEGSFENGVKSGKGIYFFDDGSIYKGKFSKEYFEGHGVLTSMNGGNIFSFINYRLL